MSHDISTLVLCSGGVDSATVLADAVCLLGSEKVVSLSIFYGQKHARELDSAKALSKYYRVRCHCLDLSGVFVESECSLLEGSSSDIPHTSYAEQLSDSPDGFVNTYVPFRNGLFLSAACSVALSFGASTVLYGAHHDDWAGNAYPDCSASFVHAMDAAIREGTGGALHLEAPFVGLSKAEIVKRGLQLAVPYELTWSCYEGGDVPCGICGTCRDRAYAFQANQAPDPLLQ